MTNLESRINSLRTEMGEKYAQGKKDEALALSLRLDKLIALAQREAAAGRYMLQTEPCDRCAK